VRRPERPHAPGRFRTSPPGGRLDSKWRSFLVGVDQLAEAAASCSAGGNRAHELRSEGATSAVSLVGDARIRHHVEEIDDRRCRKLQAWELRVHASGRCRCASIATCDTTCCLRRFRSSTSGTLCTAAKTPRRLSDPARGCPGNPAQTSVDLCIPFSL
jgi:hypothetical protein